MVQRDIYSAFVIMGVNETLNEVDSTYLEEHFDTFLKMQEEKMEELKEQSTMKSMGVEKYMSYKRCIART